MPVMLGAHERSWATHGRTLAWLAERLARRHVERFEAAALRRSDRRLIKDALCGARISRRWPDACRIAAQVDFLADLNGPDLNARASFLQDEQNRASMISGPMPSP